jgi:hypothetical protein
MIRAESGQPVIHQSQWEHFDFAHGRLRYTKEEAAGTGGRSVNNLRNPKLRRTT